jgi:hypothetical protein
MHHLRHYNSSNYSTLQQHRLLGDQQYHCMCSTTPFSHLLITCSCSIPFPTLQDPQAGISLLHSTLAVWTHAMGLPGGYLPTLVNIALPLAVLLVMTVWWEHYVRHRVRESLVAGYRLAAAALYLVATWLCSQAAATGPGGLFALVCHVSSGGTAVHRVLTSQSADAAALGAAAGVGDSPGWQVKAPLLGPLLLVRAAALPLPWLLQAPVSVCEWVLYLSASQILQQGQPWSRGLLTGVDSLLTGVVLPALVVYLLEQRARVGFLAALDGSSLTQVSSGGLAATATAAAAATGGPGDSSTAATAVAAAAEGVPPAAVAAAEDRKAAAAVLSNGEPPNHTYSTGAAHSSPHHTSNNHVNSEGSVFSHLGSSLRSGGTRRSSLGRRSVTSVGSDASLTSGDSAGSGRSSTAPDTPTSLRPEAFRRVVPAPGVTLPGIQLLGATAAAGRRLASGSTPLYRSSHSSILVSCKVASGGDGGGTGGLTGDLPVLTGPRGVTSGGLGQVTGQFGMAMPDHPAAGSSDFQAIAQQLAAAARAAVIEAAADVQVMVVSSEAITFPGCVQAVLSAMLQPVSAQDVLQQISSQVPAGTAVNPGGQPGQSAAAGLAAQLPPELILTHLQQQLGSTLDLQQMAIYYYDDNEGVWEGWKWEGASAAGGAPGSSALTAAPAAASSSAASSSTAMVSGRSTPVDRPASPAVPALPAPAGAQAVQLGWEGWWIEPLVLSSGGDLSVVNMRRPEAPSSTQAVNTGSTTIKLHLPEAVSQQQAAVRVVLGSPDNTNVLLDAVLPVQPGQRVVVLPPVAVQGVQQLRMVVLTASEVEALAGAGSSSTTPTRSTAGQTNTPPAQLLAVLPMLAVPARCCTELQQLFNSMTEACEGSACMAYGSSFAPLVRDLSAVLAGPATSRLRYATTGAVQSMAGMQQYRALVSDMLGYLEEQGLPCCCSLVSAAAQAAVKAAALTGDAGGSEHSKGTRSGTASPPPQMAADAASQHAAVAEAAAAAVQQQLADAAAAVAEARAVLERTQATARQVSRQAAQAQHAARRAQREAAVAQREAVAAAGSTLVNPVDLPEQLTPGDVVWGWQQPGLEEHYQTWKASVLLGQDRLALLLQLTRQGLFVYKVLQGVRQLTSGLTVLLLVKYEVVTLAPYLVMLGFGRFYQRHRSAMLVLSQLAAAITTGLITATEVYRREWQVLMTSTASNVVVLQRPFMMAAWFYLLLPLLLGLSAGGQLWLCGALTVQAYLFYRFILYGGLGSTALLLWLVLGVAVAWVVGVARDALLRVNFIKAVQRYRAAPALFS